MLKRAITMLAVLLIAFAAQAMDIERFELPNGVRVMYFHVADAPKQSTFTFLPPSLATDDANRAQWSHLLEHMLIRSTDPDTLTPPGAILNGETMHNAMRLETFCNPDKWRENLQRHANWITARQFDAATLAREKTNIEGEERGTSERGFTTKWAIAAWNQVARHGITDVKLHGDVAGAALNDVQQYAAAQLPIDDTIMIASIGPADPKEFRAEIERLLADVAPMYVELKPARTDAKQMSGAFAATWELPTRHAMWWWRLPDRSAGVMASATCLGRAMRIRMQQLEKRDRLFRTCEIYPVVPTPDGTLFIIDACLPADVADDAAAKAIAVEIWKVLHEQLRELSQTGPKFVPVVYCGTMMVAEMNLQPRFAVMRESMPRNKDMLEAYWLLNAAMQEYAWGLPVEKLVMALWTVDIEALRAVLEQMSGEATGTLLLGPATPVEPARPAP